MLQETTEQFFTQYPEVLEFSWTQYTPSWNDGGVCEFGVNDPELVFSGKPIQAAYKAASKIVSSIDEETLENMFGDGVKIIVTPNGITKEDCECE